MSRSDTDAKNRLILLRGSVAVLFTTGILIRVWTAWMLRESTSSDWAVAASMARDMANGQTIPVFFYGQAYMGSFEPWVASLFVRVFGNSGFVVTLGTAFFAVVLLGQIFLWGHKTAGVRAGIAACTWSLIGSIQYLYFSVSSRGGYGALLVLGTFTLYAAAHIGSQSLRKQNAGWAWFTAMGIAAGLGWWSHADILMFILPAALILLVTLKTRLFQWRILLVPAGTLIGASPWIWWNLRHQWASVDMILKSAECPALRSGVSSLAKTLLLLFHPGGPEFLAAVIAAVIFIAFLSGVFHFAQVFRRDTDDKTRLPFLAAALLLPVFASVISLRSNYILLIQSRYLLPVWPAVCVLIGVLYNTLHKRLGAWPSVCLFTLLLIPQAFVFPYMLQSERDFAAANSQAQELAATVDQLGIEALYAGYWSQWMNYATDDRLRVAVLSGERYSPRERQAMLADRIGFLDGTGHIGSFLASTQAGASSARAGRITYHLQPSPKDFTPIFRTFSVERVLNHQRVPLPEVHDLTIDTGIFLDQDPAEEDPVIQITFLSSEKLNGLLFWCGSWQPPPSIRIEAFSEASESWVTVMPATRVSSLFWSGPRIFNDGLYHRAVFRWDPVEAVRWRISFPRMGDKRLEGVGLAELVWLRSSPPTEAQARTSWRELGHYLHDLGIREIHADRWLSQKLAFGGYGLQTELDPVFSRTLHELPKPHAREKHIRIESTSAMIAENEFAEITRHLLEQNGLFPVEEAFGSWTIFHFRRDGAWKEAYRGLQPLRWMGPTCLKAEAGVDMPGL
ncbi:MAG: glycosyltransferase family 39 protein [Kiritimatiellae bacterium]|jgi:4-amino-4-deoxy-L-arabinose transferase-like glycosyltransferase|nr:glycosyltransferase family 39 protein [Kiritimatiellia bacterium]